MRPASCVLAVVALAAVAAACGSGRQSADGPEWLTRAPRPVTLETTRDDSRAATRLITPRGGTIIATGADGTRYRLRIPEGAVASPVEITMTPLAGVSGLPLSGGSAAAVQLEPGGLRLLQPAELSIMPRTDVPVAQQVAYAYGGSGQDAHRYPIRSEPGRIEMTLLHFSGYGIGVAAPGDPGRAALQQASSYEARLSARLAEAIDADREAGHERLTDDTRAMMARSMVEYYDAILRPLMQRAESDWRMAECCTSRYLEWERFIQLLLIDGGSDSTTSPELETRRTQAQQSSRVIARNYFEQGTREAIRRCREGHDLSAVATVLAMVRQAVLLDVPTDGLSMERVQEELTRCLRFEVEFRSTFDNGAPQSTRMTYEVAAAVPVQLNPFVGAAFVHASAPLEYVRFVAVGNPKEAVWGSDGRDERTAWLDRLTSFRISPKTTRPSTFVVHTIEWDLNVIERPGTDCDGTDRNMRADSVAAFSITFSPGIPVEVTRAEPVSSGVPPFDMESTAWARHWSRAHGDVRVRLPGVAVEDEELDGPFRMTLDAAEPGTWTRSFDHDSGEVLGYTLVERGHVTVRHTPD